jgi:hypothetical protein
VPEFDISILTIRSGIHTVRTVADDAAAARRQVQAECDAGRCDCPPERCGDDIQITVVQVKQVALDGVTIISADGVGLGTLYTDDTLRQARSAERDPAEQT